MSAKNDLRMAYAMGFEDGMAGKKPDNTKADVLAPHPWADRADEPREETTDGGAPEAPSDERITSELRRYATYTVDDRFRQSMLDIADRIDAVHEEALSRAYMDVSDSEWVRLPKDADGEPIHVGDELHDDWYEQIQGEVEWLMLDHHGWWLMFKNNCERFYVHELHEWHHRHAPTVEDVLREFAQKMNENMGMYTGEAIDADEWQQADSKTIAEYATKLQLREEA